MIGVDLLLARRELLARAGGTMTASSDYRLAHGLDWRLIAAHAGTLAVVQVEFLPQGRFEFADDGEPAAVIEALDTDGETVLDLVAWPVAEPTRVTSLFGRAPLVGMYAAVNPATYFWDRPLQVHRTPLDWLKAGFDGCAVVEPRLAARVLNDDVPGRIAGQDAEHARELATLLRSVVNVDRVVAPVRRAA